jgi:hypothetical protein
VSGRRKWISQELRDWFERTDDRNANEGYFCLSATPFINHQICRTQPVARYGIVRAIGPWSDRRWILFVLSIACVTSRWLQGGTCNLWMNPGR